MAEKVQGEYLLIYSLFIWHLPEQDNIDSNFAAHLEYHLASGSVCFKVDERLTRTMDDMVEREGN